MVKAIPDRWLNYQPIGEQIEGTRFIPFKVPLREYVNETVKDEGLRLSPRSLLESVPNLGLIIDLTNTNRFYNPRTFTKENVEHQKLMIPGHQTPSRALAKKFCQYVNNFLEANADNDKLIGVHCTHGINRTGYLICYFMITELNVSPVVAIQTFADARGHKIERKNYTSSLLGLLQQTEQHERSPSIPGLDNPKQDDRQRKRHYEGNERREYEQRYEGGGQRGGENWRQRSQEQQPESWQRQRNYATPRSYDHQQEPTQTYTKWRKFSDNYYSGRQEEAGSTTSRNTQQSWRYGQPEADRGYASSSSSRNHSSNRYKYVRENNGYSRDGDNYHRRNNPYSHNGNNFGNKGNNSGNNGYYNGHSRNASTSHQRHRYSNGEDY